MKRIIHHSFQDPFKVKGTDEEKLAAFRQTKDEIKRWLIADLDKIGKEMDRDKDRAF